MTPEYILMWIGDVIQISSGSVNKYGKWNEYQPNDPSAYRKKPPQLPYANLFTSLKKVSEHTENPYERHFSADRRESG